MSVDNDKLTGYFLWWECRYLISGTRLDEVPKGTPPVVPISRIRLIAAEKPRCGGKRGGAGADIRLWPAYLCGGGAVWSRAGYLPMSTTCTPACRRWTAGRRSRSGCSSTPAAGAVHAPCRECRYAAAANLAQAVEPAQYYTRQHLKFRAGNYHQFEPLNRFADALNAGKRHRAPDEQMGRPSGKRRRGY
ncbi:hypothetical protein KIF59_11560 [Enterobacter cloacae subsp. cloacae]|nr:hypothetical protein [Enterobacter cloacae subsp. cloacae]